MIGLAGVEMVRNRTDSRDCKALRSARSSEREVPKEGGCTGINTCSLQSRRMARRNLRHKRVHLGHGRGELAPILGPPELQNSHFFGRVAGR
jgi:hypothetical protein